MAVPARGNRAAAQDPAPEREPDPRAEGWADVQRASVTEMRAVGLAAAEVARRPGDQAALDMLELAVSVLQSMGDISRRLTFGEAGMDAEYKRGFEAGFAAGHALRGRLSVVSSA